MDRLEAIGDPALRQHVSSQLFEHRKKLGLEPDAPAPRDEDLTTVREATPASPGEAIRGPDADLATVAPATPSEPGESITRPARVNMGQRIRP